MYAVRLTGMVAYMAASAKRRPYKRPTCCLHLGLRQNLLLDPGRSRDSPDLPLILHSVRAVD